ncbi:MAG: molybdenum cofactor guanylyltransferase [Thermaurantiacus sp.]
MLAGGRSRRFGADKALHEVDGKPLIGHVAAALAPQVELLMVSGREWGGLPVLDDMPGPGLGPLGGLAAALCHANGQSFDAVLTAPCDTLGLPADLAKRLGTPPAVIEDQWLAGLWQPEMGAGLLHWLDSGGSRAVGDWLRSQDVRRVSCAGLRNVNHPEDGCSLSSPHF